MYKEKMCVLILRSGQAEVYMMWNFSVLLDWPSESRFDPHTHKHTQNYIGLIILFADPGSCVV